MSFFALFFSLAAAAGITAPSKVLHDVQDGNAILVDVREPDEVAGGKIAGAQTFPSSKVGSPEWSKFMKTLPKDKTVYVYCAAGGRAGKVADELKAKGFKGENAGGYSELAQSQSK